MVDFYTGVLFLVIYFLVNFVALLLAVSQKY